MKKYSYQARRQRGAGGAMPPRFSFLPPPPPPDFFLAPHGVFLGGRSWCFWAEKTLKFAISARKRLRISAKTFFWRSPAFGRKIRVFFFFFFVGDHLLLVGKFVISTRKSLRISAKTFAPPISRSWRRP